MKKRNAVKGFAKPQTQKFTVEILRRHLQTGDEIAVEEYILRVEIPRSKRDCPQGWKPWDVAVRTALELAHIRLYDLYFDWLELYPGPSQWGFDGFLWRNRTEGEPIFQISTHCFQGSAKLPMLDDPDSPVDEIRVKEVGRVIRKIN